MTKLPEGSPFFTFGSCCFGKLVAGWTLPLFSFLCLRLWLHFLSLRNALVLGYDSALVLLLFFLVPRSMEFQKKPRIAHSAKGFG